MYDLLIQNARILDGTGAPWFYGDLAVKDGKIAAVGKVVGDAKTVVDAAGQYLSPGFIDIHSHRYLDIPQHYINILIRDFYGVLKNIY